jgi:hypothetical protein
MNRVLAALVTGAGLGMGTRGIMGFKNLMRPRPAVDMQSSIPVNVPIHLPHEDDMDSQMMAKSAIDTYWEMPAGVAAGAGGLYGGWKLMDWIMSKRRKQRMGSELDTAKRQYEQALKDQYSSAMMSKTAAAPGATLDAVFDKVNDPEHQAAHLEKVAFLKSITGPIDQAAKLGTNAYLTALMAITGGAGLGAYSWTKSRSKAKALERAVNKRRQMRAAPQPIMAIPQYDI